MNEKNTSTALDNTAHDIQKTRDDNGGDDAEEDDDTRTRIIMTGGGWLSFGSTAKTETGAQLLLHHRSSN